MITFNYDLALDYALRMRHVAVDRGLSAEKGPGIPYLKLHGSLDWARCVKCKRVVPFDAFRLVENNREGGYCTFPVVSKRLKEIRCPNGACGGALVEDRPFIIPPAWSKARHREGIQPVWMRAAEELADAQNIFVVGYSMPDTDPFFKYLLGLGVRVATPVRRLWVWDKEDEKEDGRVKARFKKVLGSGVIEKFGYRQALFEEAVGKEEVSHEHLGDPPPTLRAALKKC